MHKKVLSIRARLTHNPPMPQKSRNGAFWEDRYHATAIQTNEHLIRCTTYIDLSMVCAGVVKHPNEWSHSGYNEIQKPKQRYGIIDFKSYMSLVQIEIHDELNQSHQQWVEKPLKQSKIVRESKWTQSIAVGDKSFLEQIKEWLEFRAKGRKIYERDDEYQLREGQTVYGDWPDSEYEKILF